MMSVDRFCDSSFILLPYFLAATNNHFFSFHSISFRFVLGQVYFKLTHPENVKSISFCAVVFCFFGNKFNDFLQPNFCCTRNVSVSVLCGAHISFLSFLYVFWFFFALFVLLRLYVGVVFIFFIRSFSLLEFIGQQ